MSDDQNQFEKGDAGSADCVPSSAGQVKKGGYCMLKGFPCKVTQYSTAKPGKHGSAKATIVGVDIFTNKKYEDTWPTSAGVSIPNVSKVQYTVADINADGFVQYINQNGELDATIKMPTEDEEIFAQLTKVWENRGDSEVLFSLLSSCGKKKFVSGRTK